MGAIGRWIKPRFQDLAMRQMNDYRPATVGLAEGDVLEIYETRQVERTDLSAAPAPAATT